MFTDHALEEKRRNRPRWLRLTFEVGIPALFGLALGIAFLITFIALGIELRAH